jgi:hypothetical protein
VVEHFTVQSQFLQKKATALIEASNTLQNIISDCGGDKSIPWKTIIKLIEVYKMTQQLEHSWVKDIFTPEELKQYATFESEMKSHSTPAQKATFEKNWMILVKEFKNNLSHDSRSEIGINLAKKCMILINELYGKKYAHLRTKKFEQGYAEGKGLEETGMTPEIVSWLEHAMDAYWHDRIYGILNKVGSESSDTILKLWNEVLDDMYGEDNAHKIEIYGIALADQKISQAAKDWLKTL